MEKFSAQPPKLLTACGRGMSSLHPVGVALGITVPDQSVLFGVSGYLIGASGAALLPTQPATRTRRALLVPRRAVDYLPRFVLVLLLVAATVSLATIVVYIIEPHRTLPTFSGSTSGIFLAIGAAMATGIAVRVVVARSQPVSTQDLVAVDDAMRSQALHTLTGAGLAVTLIGTGSCLLEMGGYANNPWLHVGGGIAGLVAFVGALLAWSFRSSAWQVARPVTL
jgi:hypothetical protein